MKEVYGDDCLCRSRIHEWFKRFQEGREVLEDDERSVRPRNVVNEENAAIVREFIRKEPKSSLKYVESELRMSAASIYSILSENLGYIKVCVKFVPNALKPHEKDQKSHCNHQPFTVFARYGTLRLLLVRKTSFGNERKTLC